VPDQKTLLQHILDGSLRPQRHGRLIAARNDLPIKPPHPDPTGAMSRLWVRLRQLQQDIHDQPSVEIRHDLVLQFCEAAAEYMSAVEHAKLDPTDDVAGIENILAANDRARASIGVGDENAGP
jgi:hypothetical protein